MKLGIQLVRKETVKQEQHYLQLLNFKGKTKNWLKGVRFYCLIKELYMILNICKILLDEVVDKINFWFNESKTLLWTQCQTNFKSKHVMYIFPFVHMLIGDAYEFLLWEWEDFCSVFLPIVCAKRKRLVSCHALILVSGKIKSRGRWEPTFSKSGKIFVWWIMYHEVYSQFGVRCWVWWTLGVHCFSFMGTSLVSKRKLILPICEMRCRLSRPYSFC